MFVMTYRMEQQRQERNRRILFVVLAIAATAAGAVIASMLTKTDTPWYLALKLSPIQPPPWVFGAVWTALYVLLAISFARMAAHPRVSRIVIIGFIVNIVLNALWSPVFFLMNRPRWSLVILAALIANLIILMRNIARVDRLSFRLLIPYLCWLCIATFLNASVVVLN